MSYGKMEHVRYCLSHGQWWWSWRLCGSRWNGPLSLLLIWWLPTDDEADRYLIYKLMFHLVGWTSEPTNITHMHLFDQVCCSTWELLWPTHMPVLYGLLPAPMWELHRSTSLDYAYAASLSNASILFTIFGACKRFDFAILSVCKPFKWHIGK